MSCEVVNSYLIKESNRITGDIARRGRATSPWNAVLEKDFFPDEVGFTISRVVYQRTVPVIGEGSGWNPVSGSTSEATSTACAPIAATLSSRALTQSAQLSEFVLDSDPLCISDARAAVKFKQQVAEIKNNFEKNVIDAWEMRDRSEYCAIIPDANRLVFNGGSLTAGSGGNFAGVQADSSIHQDVLDSIRWKLIHDGAGEDGAYAMVDGQPVFVVVMSSEQQRQLIKGNADIRQDYRYADPKELLKPFGVKRVYGGLFHLIDDKAPRYDYDAEADDYIEVPFYTTNEAGIAIVNPDYESALYEKVIFYHPKVCKRLMQKPLSDMGSGASVKAWNYAGQVEWINEYDKECNKYKDTGYWSARLRAAYQPNIPEYGYEVMVLRCPGSLGTTPCPTS